MTRRPPGPRPDLTRMVTLLAQENRALKQADMPGLIRLAPRKEALLARLEGSEPGRGNSESTLLESVRRDAARNARLFEATLRGLRDAHALIDRYKGQRGDQTYARDGGRSCVDPPRRTLERRA